MENTKTKSNIMSRKYKRVIFYTLLMAIPSIQFAIFYFYVNFNSVILSFKVYDMDMNVSFGFLSNLEKAWEQITIAKGAIINSSYIYLCNLAVVTVLALFFSYYIAKKYLLSGFFRVMLFMPSIISHVTLVVIYKVIMYEYLGIDSENKLAETFVILFYNIWIGFGTNVMMYTGSMSSIDPSIVESAQLDGVNFAQEFIHIYIPMIWPTFITFVITGLAGMFTSSMSLTAFYGENGGGSFDVFGYFLYRNIISADYRDLSNRISYSVLSLMGLMVTVVLVPVTLGVRKVMESFGPSTEREGRKKYD